MEFTVTSTDHFDKSINQASGGVHGVFPIPPIPPKNSFIRLLDLGPAGSQSVFFLLLSST